MDLLMHNTDKRFYGIYKGICVDNADPLNLGRITVQVPQVTGSAVSNWVDTCNQGGGLAVVGGTVWIMYMGGDPNFPVWMGV